MKNWKLCFMASAAIGCWGIAEPASAQIVYGGGATFPAPVYRQLFDCHSHQVDGNGGLAPYPISPKCGSPTGDQSGLFMWILYSPVGSGAGKRALIAHDGSNTATGLGTPGASNNVPYIDSAAQPSYSSGYPSVQFAGSDDPWTKKDSDDYTATGNASRFGNILQIPALAGAVVIAFNGNSGGTPLNIATQVPAGAIADKAAFGYSGNYSGLNLTRKAVCGIFTGHITAWNDPELTAANGGAVLGTGPLKVVRRSDGSGTTFLFANALYRQCQGVSGPINTADALSGSPSTRSWEFRWADTSGSACPDAFYRAANSLAWPGVSLCGSTVATPAGSTFIPASGNGGVKTAIEGNDGAIGYSTTDYAQPVLTTGMKVANIQSEFDLNNNTGEFQWPSPTRITNAMAAASPILPTPAAIANPLNWSAQGQVPNPGTPESYPIAGFTWIDLYQCYDSTRTGGGTFENLMNYVGFHYYYTEAAAIINAAGFATIPNSWRDPIIPLITSSPSRMSNGLDTSNPGCATRSGA